MFENGAQSVVNVVVEKLMSHNIEIKLNTPVTSISNWNIGGKIVITCGMFSGKIIRNSFINTYNLIID